MSDNRVSPVLVSNKNELSELDNLLIEIKDSKNISDWDIKRSYIA
jgi:hypothetical protein